MKPRQGVSGASNAIVRTEAPSSRATKAVSPISWVSSRRKGRRMATTHCASALMNASLRRRGPVT
ncbi:Uncharacterised protein [Bordetella pertussis]|nr:Uncharacterised protein [Bordetella pertussis]CFM07226.1 Uncharacterised protein [Bordetella pertussis]CFN58721.1 Uncharacterised protein [Bordetella pertussis]CFN74844.1 Uncharacterised protein [Bordetella pertussis]CFO03380.1 Uncharacterised protein [Bordetella pertussis]